MKNSIICLDRNMKSSPSFWELAMETMIEALEHNNN